MPMPRLFWYFRNDFSSTVGADARLDVSPDETASTPALAARIAAAPGVSAVVAGEVVGGVRVESIEIEREAQRVSFPFGKTFRPVTGRIGYTWEALPGRMQPTDLDGDPAGPAVGDDDPSHYRVAVSDLELAKTAPGPVQPLQQRGVQAVPDAGPLPVAEPTPAGHPAPAAQLLRQPLPRDAGPQHEDDACQAGPVRHPRPPAAT